MAKPTLVFKRKAATSFTPLPTIPSSCNKCRPATTAAGSLAFEMVRV